MTEDIFNLLMLILLLENGTGQQDINTLVIMFLLMQNKTETSQDCSCGCSYTF